jgi:hypothetical protein
MITREQFTDAVGRDPEHDDLDRCNCPLWGTPGHYSCGWNVTVNKPQFMVGIRTRWPREHAASK